MDQINIFESHYDVIIKKLHILFWITAFVFIPKMNFSSCQLLSCFLFNNEEFHWHLCFSIVKLLHGKQHGLFPWTKIWSVSDLQKLRMKLSKSSLKHQPKILQTLQVFYEAFLVKLWVCSISVLPPNKVLQIICDCCAFLNLSEYTLRSQQITLVSSIWR